jgi:hypothetical protein
LPGVKPPRLSDSARGIIIAAFIALYGWFLRGPAGSLTVSLLIAAGVQIAMLAVRRLVPADQLPQAMEVVEVIADGVTVLLFAVGVLGGIANTTAIS